MMELVLPIGAFLLGVAFVFASVAGADLVEAKIIARKSRAIRDRT